MGNRVPANKNLELAIEDAPGFVRRDGQEPPADWSGTRVSAYQAESWTTPRRIVAKVEHHVGELFPRVGFIVTNLPLSNRAVVWFYNKRGTAEQWIKELQAGGALGARLSCTDSGRTRSGCTLSVLAYNLGNLWRRPVLPTRIERWSLTSLQQRLVKTGVPVSSARYVLAFLAESHHDSTPVRGDLQRIWALPFVPAG